MNETKDLFNGKRWNQSTQQYTAGTDVPVIKNCFAWSVTNVGTGVVVVNGERLFPSAAPATIVGDSVSKSDPTGGPYKGRIKLVFTPPAGAAPLAEVTQLFYVDEKEF